MRSRGRVRRASVCSLVVAMLGVACGTAAVAAKKATSEQEVDAQLRARLSENIESIRRELLAEYLADDWGRLSVMKEAVDCVVDVVALPTDLQSERPLDILRCQSWDYVAGSYGVGSDGCGPTAAAEAMIRTRVVRNAKGKRTRITVRGYQCNRSMYPVQLYVEVVPGVKTRSCRALCYEPIMSNGDLNFPIHPCGFTFEWSDTTAKLLDNRGRVIEEEGTGDRPEELNNPPFVYTLLDAMRARRAVDRATYAWARCSDWAANRSQQSRCGGTCDLWGAAAAWSKESLRTSDRYHSAVGGSEEDLRGAPVSYVPACSIELRSGGGYLTRVTQVSQTDGGDTRVVVRQEGQVLPHVSSVSYTLRRDIGAETLSVETFRPQGQLEHLSGGRWSEVLLDGVTLLPKTLVVRTLRGQVVASAEYVWQDVDGNERIEQEEWRRCDDAIARLGALYRVYASPELLTPPGYSAYELSLEQSHMALRLMLKYNAYAALRNEDSAMLRDTLHRYWSLLEEEGGETDMYVYSVEALTHAAVMQGGEEWGWVVAGTFLRDAYEHCSNEKLAEHFARCVEQWRLGYALLLAGVVREREDRGGGQLAWLVASKERVEAAIRRNEHLKVRPGYANIDQYVTVSRFIAGKVAEGADK